MSSVFLILQMFLSLLLIGAILLQAQGTGLGSSWAGGGESYHTKRGVERVLVVLTAVGIALFAVLSIVNVLSS